MTKNNDRFTDGLVISVIQPEDVKEPNYRDGFLTGRAGKPMPDSQKENIVWRIAYAAGLKQRAADLRAQLD